MTSARSELFTQAAKLVIGVLVLAVLFELVASVTGLPGIGKVLVGVRSMWNTGTLPHDIEVSCARWLLGWIIGSVAGIALGLLTGRLESAAFGLEGLLVLARAVPFIALVPLFLRIFGLSEIGKVGLVAWASASVCWTVVHQAAKSVPPSLLWRAKSLGVSRLRWVVRILIPSCGESVYAALRTSLSLALLVTAVAEMGGVYERSSGLWWSEGLGYRLFRTLDAARDDLLLGTILVFAALGIASDIGLATLRVSLRNAIHWLRRRHVRSAIAALSRVSSSGEPSLEHPSPIRVRGLSARYDGREVITNLSLQIPPGSTLGIVGPSGCGKTTLLRAIARFKEKHEGLITDGEVRIGDVVLHGPSTLVGVVMQEAPVFDRMTVWDNVTIGSNARCPAGQRRCWSLLKEFGLGDMADQFGRNLSGGQRQRLALATALANQPQVLLLDEPFGALDAITRRQLQRFFWQHVHGRVTAVFVTHDIEEATLISDKVMTGVLATTPAVEIERDGMTFVQWERSDRFERVRTALVDTLETGQVRQAGQERRPCSPLCSRAARK